MRSSSIPTPDPAALVAFNRAMADHADGLKTFAARMLGDSLAAEDVDQDAFLALYRDLEQVPASDPNMRAIVAAYVAIVSPEAAIQR